MLKRIYIDNFRCLVNFELQLGRQQLIMGLNGSGKSTLLDALRAIKGLVTGDKSPSDAFPPGQPHALAKPLTTDIRTRCGSGLGLSIQAGTRCMGIASQG